MITLKMLSSRRIRCLSAFLRLLPWNVNYYYSVFHFKINLHLMSFCVRHATGVTYMFTDSRFLSRVKRNTLIFMYEQTDRMRKKN